MKVLIVKTSEDYYYDFKNFKDIEALFDFVDKKGSVVIEKNRHYIDKKLHFLPYWDGMSKKDAKKVIKCKYVVEIYDSYRE